MSFTLKIKLIRIQLNVTEEASQMRETMHFNDVHVRFANKIKRHYRDGAPFLRHSCSFCFKGCPSAERLGGIFYG